jgi:CheY-like chemotaxis protein
MPNRPLSVPKQLRDTRPTRFEDLGLLPLRTMRHVHAMLSANGDPPFPELTGAGPQNRSEETPRPISVCDVMVVDDDLAILYTLAEALEQEGYSVEIANNGAEALNALQYVRPRVVLLDLRMPVLDGWAFVDIVRERRLAFKLVLMTATPDVGHWAEEVGTDGLLMKPFELNELMDLVERLLREE